MEGEEKISLWGINGLLHHDGLLPPGFPTAFIYLVILSLSLIYAFSAL